MFPLIRRFLPAGAGVAALAGLSASPEAAAQSPYGYLQQPVHAAPAAGCQPCLPPVRVAPPPQALPPALPPMKPERPAEPKKDEAKKDDTAPQQQQPQQPQQPQPDQQQQQDQSQQDDQQGARAAATGGGEFATANVIGDIGIFTRPRSVRVFVRPGVPESRISGPPAPLSAFKIGENENPRPVDRIFFTSNYFNNVNSEVNDRLQNGLGLINAYRQTFGFEKTFLDGNASFGLRMPLNTVTAEAGQAVAGGLNLTSLGDLTLISKFSLLESEAGDLLSAGLAVTVPTGPGGFGGGNSFLQTPRQTYIQPYVGFIANGERDYLQGFTSFNFATDDEAPTFYFFDLSYGRYLVKNRGRDARLNSLAAIFEVHVNVPLSNDDPFLDLFGVAPAVVLTQGLTFQFRQNAFLTVGVAEPVTGVKPFDVEGLIQFNWRF